jgi:small subunit ribosomal protein S20
MPNTASAKKALRQNRKRRMRNRSQRSTIRTAVKNCRQAIDAGDKSAAQQAIQFAAKRLDQAAAKNLIHKNAAARTKSRLSKLMKSRFAQTPAAAPE